MENPLLKRKTIRIKDYDYSNEGMYFITICTKNKIPLLSKIILDTVGNDALVVPNKIGNIIDECWKNIETQNENIFINEYVIMPNHIHGIIEIKNQKERELKIEKKYGFEVEERRGRRSLQSILKDFKSVTTRKYNKIVNEKYKNMLWQKSYYEHIIRNEKEYYEIVKYIKNNPLKWIYNNEKNELDFTENLSVGNDITQPKHIANTVGNDFQSRSVLRRQHKMNNKAQYK